MQDDDDPKLDALALDLMGRSRVADLKSSADDLTKIIKAAHPLLRLLVPVLREAQPVVDYLALYKEELLAQISGLAAATEATQATGSGPPLHYLRALAESIIAQNIRTVICIPLRARRVNPDTQRGDVLGILYLDSRLNPSKFTQVDNDLLKTIAPEAAALMEPLVSRAASAGLRRTAK